MRLSHYVTKEDVLESIELIKSATQAAAIDPSTGQIDMNYLATGYSSTYQKQIQEIKDSLLKIFNVLEEKIKAGIKALDLYEELKLQNPEF